MATNVLISSRPLARERSRSGRNSGSTAYFAGLKNVAWSAKRKRTVSDRSSRPSMSAGNARSAVTISSDLVTMSTVRLLYTSARPPAYPEKSRKGRMKTAPASERPRPLDTVTPNTTSGLAGSDAARTTSIETTILKRLSLKAPRNWVQRKGWRPGWRKVSR